MVELKLAAEMAVITDEIGGFFRLHIEDFSDGQCFMGLEGSVFHLFQEDADAFGFVQHVSNGRESVGMIHRIIPEGKGFLDVDEGINPETGEPVPDGEIGELVLTTLDREMMPLIRYRTRDLTRILPGTCPCGRTHLRIDRIKGRSDDMFIIKGVNIFPMQVEKVLVQFPELGSNYLITLETISNQDEMIVEVELSDLSTDNYIELEKVRKAISRRLKDEILVTPKVKLVKKGSLPQSEGKAVRVKDLRDNK